MRAIVRSSYGSPDVLRLEEVERPAPASRDLLVRVRASSVNPYDWHILRGEPYVMRLGAGLRRPKADRLGLDFAGEVEAVGDEVTRFRPGDEVFGLRDGAFAEYVCVPEHLAAAKPKSLSFEEAAAVPLGAMTALQGLRDAGRLQPGQRVLVIGASGGVGSFAVQLAKELGAEVTGICSTGSVERVRALGADHVVDYTKEDFTDTEAEHDLALELGGMRSPAALRHALTRDGTLVLSSGEAKGRWIGPMGRLAYGLALSWFVRQRLCTFVTKPSGKDLELLRELIDAGKLRPEIDRVFGLDEVPEAIRALEAGRVRGKIVVSV